MVNPRPHNEVHCLSFTPEVFAEWVARLSGGKSHWTTDQAEYLSAYLEQARATALLVEEHYIDRHFMQEVDRYYSSSLLYRRNFCARIHAFRNVDGRPLTPRRLAALLRSAANGRRRKLIERLQNSYLGFVVVRPLPSVPIGRTVLRPPEHEGAHHTTVPYSVHLLGLELEVHGVGFQQQDLAVGACATTAIWSVLQRVCRNEGDRTPTPSEITEAAVRHFLPAGRPFPSPGLTVEQICEAFRGFDFPPLIFEPRTPFSLFKLRLGAHLRSGTPALLALRSPEDRSGHAVAAVGLDTSSSRSISWTVGDQRLDVHHSDYDRLLVHDDRVGCYLPAELSTVTITDATGESAQRLTLSIPVGPGKSETRIIELAVVPLYPKLRGSAYELLQAAFSLAPALQEIAGSERLGVDLFFRRSGSYLSSLYSLGTNPSHMIPFQKGIALSRYIGVVRWFVDGRHVLDSVWDTTDTLRRGREFDQLLGIVVIDDAFRPGVETLARHVGVPVG